MTDIVVGLDDSPSAWAAVTWAATYARRTGARLRAIHVLGRAEAPEAYASVAVPNLVYPDTESLDPIWTVRSQKVFTRLAPEPGWTLQFAKGHAGHVLVDESREAALLVLGTREHRGVGRLVSGSVSHYCINHAACPVVAVPTSEGHVPETATETASEHGREPAST